MGARSQRRPARVVASLALLVALAAFLGLAAGGQKAAGALRPAPAMVDKRPTKEEFVRRFARLCDARHRAVTSLGVPFTSPPDYARRGPDKIRIEHNFDRAASALPRPAEHRLADRAMAEYHRYLRLLPELVRSARHHERRAWVLMSNAHAYLSYASNDIQRYGGRAFCNVGP
jgi:hypothetical protein